MKTFLLSIILAGYGFVADGLCAEAESLYFPPHDGEWKSVKPTTLGWNTEKLAAAIDYAGSQRSSGLLILKNGRILAEKYWPAENWDSEGKFAARLHGQDKDGHNIEDVASVQKSVAALLVGIAQHKGLLNINDPVHKHLGVGWSRATPEQEAQVTMRHLITMTSGLKADLTYEAPPGTRWFYNTTAYSHSIHVTAAAAGKSPNELTAEWLIGPLGMKHSKWVERGAGLFTPNIKDTNVFGFATTNRDLARVGLMVLADGKWEDQIIIADTQYLYDATHPSQSINPSYGYLWWLNGQKIFRRGAGKTAFDGPRNPNAPDDLIAGLGALGRKLYVVPSMGLVITRLGNQPPDAGFDRKFWRLLMDASPQ